MNKFIYFTIACFFLRLSTDTLADNSIGAPAALDIKRIDYPGGQLVPSNAWDSVDSYYKIETKKANQPICIKLQIGANSSIRTTFYVQGGVTILRPKITTPSSNSIVFDIDLESNGIHNSISYSADFPSAIMYRYYQSGTSDYQASQSSAMHMLDYLAPYEKNLAPVGSRLSFGFENTSIPFLIINGKRYRDKDYEAIRLEVGLSQ